PERIEPRACAEALIVVAALAKQIDVHEAQPATGVDHAQGEGRAVHAPWVIDPEPAGDRASEGRLAGAHRPVEQDHVARLQAGTERAPAHRQRLLVELGECTDTPVA